MEDDSILSDLAESNHSYAEGDDDDTLSPLVAVSPRADSYQMFQSEGESPKSAEGSCGPVVSRIPSARNRHGEIIACPPGLGLPAGVSSRGSALHFTGNCQPCAWFWRPGSCRNGRECEHCHSCPQGEIKARKRQKHAILNSAVPLGRSSSMVEGFPGSYERPQKVNLVCKAVSDVDCISWDVLTPRKVPLPRPAGVVSTRSDGWSGLNPSAARQARFAAFLEEQEEARAAEEESVSQKLIGDESSHSTNQANDAKAVGDVPTSPPVGATSALQCDILPPRNTFDDEEASENSQVAQVFEEANPQEAARTDKASLPKPSGPSESVGSALHLQKQCRPCAWYWRPGSCQNGYECMHCHLCSEGEVKQRKKAKVAALRRGILWQDSPENAPNPKVKESHLESAEEQAPQGSSSPNEPALIGTPLAGRRESTFGFEQDTTASGSCSDDSAKAIFPYAANYAGDGLKEPTSSLGSILHGTGECWPCLQMFNPNGCPDKLACKFCHFCPRGPAKKSRRRQKQLMSRISNGPIAPAVNDTFPFLPQAMAVFDVEHQALYSHLAEFGPPALYSL